MLRAVPNGGQKITAADMQLAPSTVPARIANLARTPGGRLQIFDFEPSLPPPTATGNQRPAPLRSLYGLLTAVQSRADEGSPQAYYLFKAKGHQAVEGPAPSRQELFSPFKRTQPPTPWC